MHKPNVIYFHDDVRNRRRRQWAIFESSIRQQAFSYTLITIHAKTKLQYAIVASI